MGKEKLSYEEEHFLLCSRFFNLFCDFYSYLFNVKANIKIGAECELEVSMTRNYFTLSIRNQTDYYKKDDTFAIKFEISNLTEIKSGGEKRIVFLHLSHFTDLMDSP